MDAAYGSSRLSYQPTRLRYAAMDQLLGRGLVPDLALRAGARYGVRKVLRREHEGGVEAEQRRLTDLVARKSAGPIAIATDAANEQHYEIPPAFFDLFLGARRKYSGCLWPPGTETIERAEEESLRLTCERAGIADGQRVLDLGCGWGSMTLWIAEKFPACRITAVSNSAPQRRWIEDAAERRGLSQRVEVITADVTDLELPEHEFDRIVSIEMFEHLNNWAEILRRISTWVKPEGLLFLHVFSHRTIGYLYEDTWGAERFFTAGVMPSHDLLLSFQRDMILRRRWAINGVHYSKTLAAWLERLDDNRRAAFDVLLGHYGDRRRAKIALANWRLFLIACVEIWGHNRGEDWIVSHYLFEPRASTNAV